MINYGFLYGEIKLFKKYENYVLGYYELNQHPFKDYIGGLIIDNSDVVKRKLIPNQIRKLIFSIELNQNELIDKIPNSITSINILPSLNVEPGKIPKHIKHLIFHYSFKKPLCEGFIEDNIETIIISNNLYLIQNLPDSIQSIIARSNESNPSYIKIPSQLRYLECPSTILRLDNESFSKLKFLKHFKYTKVYNDLSSLNSKIPNCVKFLTLENVIIEPNLLPNNVEYLVLYNCILNTQSTLPSSIKTLITKGTTNVEKLKFTNGIINLEIEYIYKLHPNIFPDSIKSLKLGNHFNQGYSTWSKICEKNHQFIYDDQLSFLNNGLESLEMGNSFNCIFVLNSLPNTLTSLSLGYTYNRPFNKDSLPKSLKHLKLGSDYDQPINRYSFPNGLLSIEFGYSFNQPLYDDQDDNEYGFLPQSLTTLTFGRMFNHPLPKILSSNLINISFGYKFNQKIDEKSFNLNVLEKIKVPSEYNKSLLSKTLEDYL